MINDLREREAELSARALGDTHAAVGGDLSNEEQVNAMVAAVIDKFGRIDIFVNNAGVPDSFVPTVDQPLSHYSGATALTRTLYGPHSHPRTRVIATKRDSADAWVMAGDLIDQFENFDDNNEADPYYIPDGPGSGSQTNVLLAIDGDDQARGAETRRVIPAHEEGPKAVFPSRIAKDGLHVTKTALANGARSRTM